MKRTLIMILALSCVVVFTGPAMADQFPSKTITYQIPFNPGGQSDVEARRQQPLLEKALGVKVVVQYKPGGGGSVGWANLIKQKPNGYFISGINIPHIILQPLARGKAGYKTEQLAPIALFQATPIGLAVMKDSKFKTLKDLIEYAKKNPGAVTCGGSGTWSGHHIAYLQFSHQGLCLLARCLKRLVLRLELLAALLQALVQRREFVFRPGQFLL